jgi:hypothetical protein
LEEEPLKPTGDILPSVVVSETADHFSLIWPLVVLLEMDKALGNLALGLD